MSAYSATLVLRKTIATPRARKVPEERSLLERAQSGDELAFRQLVERFQNKVFFVVRSILFNSNDVEDVAQEVFANIYFSLPKFDHRCSLGTWVYRIAVNECFDYLRKKRVRPLLYESDFREEDHHSIETLGPAHLPETDLRVAQRDLLVRLLAKLSSQDRFLLLMRELEGYSVEELSKLTGIHESTVKVKLFRARQKLAKVARERFAMATATLGRRSPGKSAAGEVAHVNH